MTAERATLKMWSGNRWWFPTGKVKREVENGGLIIEDEFGLIHCASADRVISRTSTDTLSPAADAARLF